MVSRNTGTYLSKLLFDSLSIAFQIRSVFAAIRPYGKFVEGSEKLVKMNFAKI